VFRRDETRTRGELLRVELGESWDHALRAAGHAAGGVRAAVEPRLGPAAERVRGAASSGWGSTKSALAPLGEAAQQKVRGGRSDRKPAGPGWPGVLGLLLGGIAAGAVAALLLRRWRRPESLEPEDYLQPEPAAGGRGESAEPGPATSGTPGAGGLTGDRARPSPGPRATGGGPSPQSRESVEATEPRTSRT
jgi:hypothetical protein